MKHRELYEVSRMSIWAAGLLAFSAGLISASMFVDFTEKSSMADWVAVVFTAGAAVGTWAIGIGANHYAREAHMQRLAEYRDTTRTQYDAKLRKMESTVIRLQRAELLKEVYSDVPEGKTVKDLGINDARTSLVVLRGVVPALVWPADEMQLFAGPDQLKIIHIETLLIGISQLIPVAVEAEQAGKLADYYTHHETMRELCNDIHVKSGEALASVLAAHRELKSACGDVSQARPHAVPSP